MSLDEAMDVLAKVCFRLLCNVFGGLRLDHLRLIQVIFEFTLSTRIESVKPDQYGISLKWQEGVAEEGLLWGPSFHVRQLET